MRPWSAQTRVRLALAYSGIFGIVALVAALAMSFAVARIEYAAIDEGLAARGASLSIAVTAGGRLPDGSGVAPTPGGGALRGAFVLDSHGAVVDGSDPGISAADAAETVRQANSAGSPVFRTVTVDGAPNRLWAAPARLPGGGNGVVIVTQSRVDADQVVVTTATVLLLGMLVLIIAASVLGYGLAGTALRPVREIVATARSFSDQDLHRRITLDLPPDELGQLADTFNALLDRLEQAFDTLRRFTADAAHELRAPLTLIRTEAEVALRRPRTREEYQASLATVLAETERLGRMADQLLMLARAEAGALTPQIGEVDLVALVAEATRLWQPVASARGVELVDLTTGESRLGGDHDLLRRLLDNLVDNAIRHTPSGGRVAVGCRRVDRWWELEVVDTGPGVPENARASIFERFSRADRSRGRDTGGAGLGLALCAAIAEVHGGSIRLEPSQGSGARFLVLLPATGA